MERQNLQRRDANEEVMENGSDNESEGGSDVRGLEGESKEEVMEYVDVNAGATGDCGVGGVAEDGNNGVDGENEGMADACTIDFTANEAGVEEPIPKDNEAGNEIVLYPVSEGRKDVRNEEEHDLSPQAEFNEQEECTEDAAKFHLDKSIGGGD